MYQTQHYGSGGGFAFPRLTPGIKVLLLINAGVFFANALSAGIARYSLGDFFGLSATGLLEGYGLGVLRLVTYQFVHSFTDLWHIFGNMLMLYFFGTMVEEEVGRRGIYRFYLTAGVVGGILQLLLFAVTGANPSVSIIGASGAVYGIMVYAAFMAPRMRIILIIFPIELWILVAFLLFVGVYATYLELMQVAGSGVAHGAHLGGALWGFVAFKFRRRIMIYGDSARPLGKVQQWWRRRLAVQEARQREELDRVLAKVHREGLGSLTGAERRRLDRASRKHRKQ